MSHRIHHEWCQMHMIVWAVRRVVTAVKRFVGSIPCPLIEEGRSNIIRSDDFISTGRPLPNVDVTDSEGLIFGDRKVQTEDLA